MSELIWEGASGAVGEVFETEVLINLKEGLVLPGEFEVGFGFLEGAEKALAATFYFLVGCCGADGGEGFPVFEIEGVEGVDEEFFEAGFSEELDGLFGAFGLEGVVMIPEGFVEVGEGF